MKQSKPRQLLSTKINAGLKAAVAAAIERHRKLGESIAVWEDGKVVILTADRIPPISPEK
ncbi:MAG: hypothetical protein JGK17_22800 [Microcoleus sp. PH2017_10_PVI_O_A]|uniref:hypothetical protein n=1 Tax=unclassified Microcoleus TaxID=2642155 RepID=UPI001DD3F12F|nr:MULTISPECIES: hypothetical protein [unclassified Microcoleus]TAE79368.1 MAG: hypothetical protein EAZ83_21665 [Oscillatoriales cyanobacterium]MCC3408364.1 hypothetical protein [Microcoleus sp. PH2017_10_PVI_O_A]MCC3462423.1 hypothetical protein [Microcoleus sp. PH2017_11_PCY_U_A]MCC3480321.1 hypothetical protein [Microcoleus sp. PH2017_12_PCY_D_A]MCC3527066.1 hypothetical protein [Microcoleus sp. PH2017_21_RUC_O_A]